MEQQTNGDKIRAMSDEELAKLLVIRVQGVAPCPLYMAINSRTQYLTEKPAVSDSLKWIQQPAKEESPQSKKDIKTALYTEALNVSRKIDKCDRNLDMLLGAWQALTSVIDEAGLLEDFTIWRNEQHRRKRHEGGMT